MPAVETAAYIYTTQGGWIDMVHFLFHAGRAYEFLIEKRDAAQSLEEIEAMPWYQCMWLPPEYLQELYRRSSMSPIGESVHEGFQTERMQQVMTPRSAFSYEDIPSDTARRGGPGQLIDPAQGLPRIRTLRGRPWQPVPGRLIGDVPGRI